MCIAFLPSAQGCTNRIGNLWGTVLQFREKIQLSYYRPLLHGVVYEVTSVAFRIIILRRGLSIGVNKSHIYIYIYINSVSLSLSHTHTQR